MSPQQDRISVPSSAKLDLRDRAAARHARFALPHPRVDAHQLDWHRRRAVAAGLPLLTAALGVLLLASALFRLAPGGVRTGPLATGIAALSGGALLVAAVAFARRRSGDHNNVEAATFAVVLGTAVALSATMLASGSLTGTASFELLTVVAGAAVLRPVAYAGALAGVWLLWLGAAAGLSGTTDVAGWALAMAGATVVSVVISAVRADALRALGAASVAAAVHAVRDPLTSLLNRGGLEIVGEEVVAVASRSREPIACTIVDVDGLPAISDRFGRESRDAVLVAVAGALSEVFRQADVIARWGNSEFAVLAIGTGPRADDVERRLTDRLHATALPYAPDGETTGDPFRWSVEVTAGRVVHLQWQEETLDDITSRALLELRRRQSVRRARVGDHP